MNVQEFNDQFDIQYNTIAGQTAPGIDVYEKSVYLTKAQLELVKNYYDALSNRKQKGFEASEKRRVDLKELLRRETITNFTNSLYGKKVSLPSDLYLVVREDVILSGIPGCSSKLANVKPITHDEFNIQRNNPFKMPDDTVIWRLDSNNNEFELISKYTINNYIVDYLRYPKPIIIRNLMDEYPNEDLTIENEYELSECELHKSIHAEILDRAVELALRDYKPENLESKMILDQRNE